MEIRTQNPKQEATGGLVESYIDSRHALVLPLIIVFAAFTVAYSFQVWNSWDQSGQLKVQLGELEKELPRARLVNGKMLELSRDIVNLGKKSFVAQQIVREFNIRVDAGRDSDSK